MVSAMNDMLDLHQNDDSGGPGFDKLVSSLNIDQSRVYEKVNSHLEHQKMHETDACRCTDFNKPLHMFVTGVGGTGKSFLIKTIRVQDNDEPQSTLSAVPPDWLLQYHHPPTSHRARGQRSQLAKDALKIMRASLSVRKSA